MNTDTRNEVLEFIKKRNWNQYHNPKDLAISITLEASELLELFQWSSWEEVMENKKEDIADELADVLIYCTLMANAADLDIDEIITNKLNKNNEKYPLEKAYGKKEKYTNL